MSATATITTKTKNNVIAVPLQAIVDKAPPAPSPGPAIASSAPAAPGEKPKELKGVYILDKNNKVKFLEVVTGITGESDIEITSGLDAGSEVITGPVAYKDMRDGLQSSARLEAGGANANATEHLIRSRSRPPYRPTERNRKPLSRGGNSDG